MLAQSDARRLPLADGIVRLVIADPPYGAKRPSAWRLAHKRFAEVAGNDAVHSEWLTEAFRVTAKGGAIYVFACWQTMEQWRQAMTGAGFRVRSCIVWDKVVHGLADLSTCYAPRHEFILFGAKGRHILHLPRPKDIIAVSRVPASRLTHPYEKPVALLRQLIASSSALGDTVLDPFTGSGSTGSACSELGRRFVGLDLSRSYLEMARRRVGAANVPLELAL